MAQAAAEYGGGGCVYDYIYADFACDYNGE
jgi:hypothetical protein